jgi:hypothetical protein
MPNTGSATLLRGKLLLMRYPYTTPLKKIVGFDLDCNKQQGNASALTSSPTDKPVAWKPLMMWANLLIILTKLKATQLAVGAKGARCLESLSHLARGSHGETGLLFHNQSRKKGMPQCHLMPRVLWISSNFDHPIQKRAQNSGVRSLRNESLGYSPGKQSSPASAAWEKGESRWMVEEGKEEYRWHP